MLTKCICTNCAGHLEFEEGNEGERIPCPHCGFETTLYLPGSEPAEATEKTPRWRQLLLNGKIRAMAGLLVSAALLFALYFWGTPWIQDVFGLETRFTAALALLVLCAALPFLILWLVFPLLIFLQMRRQTRLLSQLAAWTTSISYANTEPSEEAFAQAAEAGEATEALETTEVTDGLETAETTATETPDQADRIER